MGIEGKIIHEVLGPSKRGVGQTPGGANRRDVNSMEIAADAWTHPHGLTRRGGWIEDFLIYFRGIDGDRVITLNTIMDEFWRNIELTLCDRASQCDFYITICDDRDIVPRMKAATQEKRTAVAEKASEKKKVEAGVTAEEVEYDVSQDDIDSGNWELTNDAVRFNVNGDESQPVEMKLRLNSLRKIDKSQKRLWQALIPYITARMSEASIPEGRVFIFDFDDSKGAVWFDHTGARNFERMEPHHYLGEAEVAMAWWMRYVCTPGTHPRRVMERHMEGLKEMFDSSSMSDASMPASQSSTTSASSGVSSTSSDSSSSSSSSSISSVSSSASLWRGVEIHLRTSDSDILPICMLSAMDNFDNQTPLPSTIFWHNSNDGMVNLSRVAHLLFNERAMSIRFFVIFCIMCGNNDYMTAEEKKLYSFRIGVPGIYAAMSWGNEERFERHLISTSSRAFYEIVHRFLTKLHGAKTSNVPTLDVVRRIATICEFTYEYWNGARAGSKPPSVEWTTLKRDVAGAIVDKE